MTDNSELERLMELAGKDMPSLTPALKTSLDQIAQEVIRLEADIETLEEQLKARNGRYNYIKTNMLPSVLQSVGVSSYETTSGVSITLGTAVNGSLPKEDMARAKALDIVKGSGGEGLIKTKVSIEFGIGQLAEAEKVLEAIGRLGYNHAALEQTIHPMSLASFVREKLEKGEQINNEAIGIYVAPIAKVKVNKRKAAKQEKANAKTN